MSKLTPAQFRALESAIKTGSATSHLSGMSDWGGWGGTRAALQRKGYLDAACNITEAGRAAIAAKTPAQIALQEAVVAEEMARP